MGARGGAHGSEARDLEARDVRTSDGASWGGAAQSDGVRALEGCTALGEVLNGCRLVLLSATAEEAAPLLAGLTKQTVFEIATKRLVTGRLLSGQSAGLREGDREDGPRVVVAVGGCDKANTAHVLTCVLQAMTLPPAVVLQVGIAGAFLGTDGAGAQPGDVVLASEEVYADTGTSSPAGWLSAGELGLPMALVGGREAGNCFALDQRLVKIAAEAVMRDLRDEKTAHDSVQQSDNLPGPRVIVGRCLTASQATGLAVEATVLAERWGAVAESMEGAAAAHVCALYGVPFLEVRGVSNLITDRERASWSVERAIAVAGRAALAVCRALTESISGVGGQAP
jgi:futalosine hydrolase